MNLLAEIKRLAKSYTNELIKIRRHLHKYPELSFQEKQTSLYIQDLLDRYCIPYKKVKNTNAVIATIKGRDSGTRAIALRADIDALPIQEKNKLSYKSVNNGVMHACGHDVHTTCVIGAAKILSELKNNFSGNVKIIFQHAEEKLPGGAIQLIKAGVLKNPDVNLIIAQHVEPKLPVGTVGFKPGVYMASCDELYIKVSSLGGHAALPNGTADTVLTASKIIIELKKQILAISPKNSSTILTFGKVVANGATNIIPSEVLVEGTIRTFDEAWRERAKKLMQKIATTIAKQEGATCDFTIIDGYPSLINNVSLTQKSIKLAHQYFSKDQVKLLEYRTTSEDFAYYSQRVPAVFYRLGVGKLSGKITALHSPFFSIDESAMPFGAGFMAWLALSLLRNES